MEKGRSWREKSQKKEIKYIEINRILNIELKQK
jgi:hypothetical protein